MTRRERPGNRSLASLVIAMAVVYFGLVYFGPAHRSPYYLLIVPLTALVVFALGWRAWSSGERSTTYSAIALFLLLAVLGLSHLLPRVHG